MNGQRLGYLLLVSTFVLWPAAVRAQEVASDSNHEAHDEHNGVAQNRLARGHE
jgi:hypothetical protein